MKKQSSLAFLLLLFVTNTIAQGFAPLTSAIKVSSGKIERIEASSQYVDNRLVDIWFPDNYPNDAPYDVLYMHDGQMLYDGSSSWNKQEWMIDENAGGLMANKIIRPVIVVGIYNISEKRRKEYFPQKALDYIPSEFKEKYKDYFDGKFEADNYLKFITEELRPYVNANYKVNADKEHTFIAGSSMGGLISMYAICEYPDIFGGAACISTHWPGVFEKNEEVTGALRKYLGAKLPKVGGNKIYFDYGDQTLDAMYPSYQKQVDMLMVEHDYTSNYWQTYFFPGENHSEEAWAKRIKIPLFFLLSKGL